MCVRPYQEPLVAASFRLARLPIISEILDFKSRNRIIFRDQSSQEKKSKTSLQSLELHRRACDHLNHHGKQTGEDGAYLESICSHHLGYHHYRKLTLCTAKSCKDFNLLSPSFQAFKDHFLI